MKKLSALLFVLPFLGLGQSSDQNYIKTTTYKAKTTTSITSPTPSQATVKISYFDGLGRPIQQIAHKQSGTGTDMVTDIRYDAFGRQLLDYLPYPTSDMSLGYRSQSTVDAGLSATPQYAGQVAFGQKELESSPLGRLLKQAAPGNDWALGLGHEVRFDYQTNAANEVRLFTAVATWNSSMGVFTIAFGQNGSSYYPAAKLYKTVTKDENWTSASGNDRTTEEFKNSQGQIVLKRTYESNVAHDTYYVYDQFDNLTYVIPPKVTGTPTQGTLNSLCYQYRYDYRNRMVQKKLPGKTWEFIVYDKLDRIVATGPANSPFTDLTGTGWMVTKYDAFDRAVISGWIPTAVVDSLSWKSMQDNRNAQVSNLSETKLTTASNSTVNGVAFRYDNASWPTSNYHILSVSYYDDYNFPNAPSTIPSSVMSDLSQAVYYNATRKPISLPTGKYVRVLETASLYKNENAYTLYDSLARPVRSYKSNYLGGYTQDDSRLHFSGRLLAAENTHKYNSSTVGVISVKRGFTYTPQDRLVTVSHQINAAAPQLIQKNEYDALGRLIAKRVGGTDVTAATCYQQIDYKYNIRGWLTDINDVDEDIRGGGAVIPVSPGATPIDLFRFRLNYQTPASTVGGLVSGLYNGNISETSWRTYNDNVKRSYGFQYDALNRLNEAFYQKPSDATPNTGSYNESIRYDRNGNITTLDRTGEYDDPLYDLVIDDLTYTYDPASPNRLIKVTDASNNNNGFKDGANVAVEYEYDSFGNMTVDRNKGIASITYNHLNLPSRITFAGSTDYIQYLYTADGAKLKKEWKSGTTTNYSDYMEGYQYSNGTLEFFPTEEGYVKVSQDGFVNIYNYVFQYKDHLGNIRLCFGLDPANNTVQVMEENNYYPFGLKHKNYNTTKRTYDKTGMANAPVACATCPKGYQYKYNGKEWQDELGLGWYDYQARNYDPAIGRWMNIDPVADMSRRFSPYTYALNNPISFVDPDGMMATPPDWVLGTDAQWSWRSDITSEGQANAAGYVGYSDGTTNNVHETQEGTTLTLKQNAKWVDSSNNIEKTAPDKANPTEIAAAKVSGEITEFKTVPEFEFSGEILMDMVGNMGDALSDGSNWAKGGGAGLVLVGAVTGNPGFIAAGIEIYNVGSAMDDIGTGMSAANDIADGNYGRAVIKTGGFIAGKASDGVMDKAIPAATGKATNATFKAASNWYIDQTKGESLNSTYGR